MRRKDYEIREQKEIMKIIRKAQICRVALHDEPYPYIVPLNYGCEEGDPPVLYFHSAKEGKKIDLIRKNPAVCFEIDCDKEVVGGNLACDWSMRYKSVIGFGTIKIVENDAEKEHGLNVLMNHYSKDKNHTFNKDTLSRTCVLKLVAAEISGKRHGSY